MSKKITKEEILKRIQEVQGDKYDYKNAVFVNLSSKIEIICPEHGNFLQFLNNHLNGANCPVCANKLKNKIRTREEFVKLAKEKYGEKYDYSLVEYKGSTVKVKIICSIHGVFYQKPKDHLSKLSCPKCSNIKTKQILLNNFIEKSSKIHKNKYTYSEVDYINSKENVKIICPEHGLFLQSPSTHLTGSGCKKCGSKKCGQTYKLTLEQFIKKANKVHHNKYDYSLTEYNNLGTKILIICPIHGIFKQKAGIHLLGNNCQQCALKKKKQLSLKSLEDFIKEANIVHNNKFDYNKTEYIGCKYPVMIICQTHGLFLQKPISHLNGAGCPQCKIQYKSKTILESFIIKANNIHDHKYNYENVVYINRTEPVKIKCPFHGVFFQKPTDHLNNGGCKKCGLEKRGESRRITQEDFIKRSNEIHNYKYEYSESVYITAKTKVKILCKIHGSFFQNPYDHMTGSECMKCTKLISKKETIWLDMLNIPNEYRNIRIPGLKRKIVDGFDPITNTVYEFYGDFWHGNPIVYCSSDTNPECKKTFGELYDATIKREILIKEAGYSLISIWELDFNKMLKEQKLQNRRG